MHGRRHRGSQQGPGTPILLEWGSWPSELFSRSDNHSNSQRGRDPGMGLSKAGMSLIYQLANRLQRLIWSRQSLEWVPPILNSNYPIDWLIRLILNSEFELWLTVKHSWEAETIKNNRLKIQGVVGSRTTVSFFVWLGITVWWGNVRGLQTRWKHGSNGLLLPPFFS